MISVFCFYYLALTSKFNLENKFQAKRIMSHFYSIYILSWWWCFIVQTLSNEVDISALIKRINAQELEDYWGTYLVTKNGVTQSYYDNGYANYRWNAEHSFESRFPIGSNTKLFTAVAMYQLQEEGLLNMDDDITDYLDETDFAKMNLNITKWCPVIYGDKTNTCQKITFTQILSMSSGLLPVYACSEMYNSSNPLYKYCWDYCTFQFLPYQGSIGYYTSFVIKAPMIFTPGTQFSYNNMNFVFASYIIEKLSEKPFSIYLKENIFDIMGLNNTYCDLWDGNFGDTEFRVDEYYLPIDDEFEEDIDISKKRAKWIPGWCHPYTSLGMSSGSGCIVSNIGDMNVWYQLLFNKNDTIPPVFKTKESREALLYPWTLMSNSSNSSQYYAQGVMVEFDTTDYKYYYKDEYSVNMNGGEADKADKGWPSLIYYNGAINCCHTAMKMISNDDESLVINAFSNAMHVYVNGNESLYKLKYETPCSICQMAYVEKLVIGDFGGPYWLANELLKIYTNGTLKIK